MSALPTTTAHQPLRYIVLQRTIRFVITVGLPLLAAYHYGMGGWVLYLIFGALLGFVGDVGGPPLLRLRFMAVGPGSLLVGALLGSFSLWLSPWLFFFFAIANGVLYGLVENRHGHLIMLARFLGYGLVFGYAVAPLTGMDCLYTLASLLWAWLMSLAWDVGTRRFTPLSVPSFRRSLWRSHRQAPKHWRFALSAGISIALAYLICLFTGNQHPYWTTLTILIVLHNDMSNSAALISQRVSGTLLGVFAVVGLVYLHISPFGLLLCALLAATLRWPAFHLHYTLGTACITAFVLILGMLMLPPGQDGLPVLQDRLLATFIGCAFALFTMQIDAFLTFLHRGWRRFSQAA